MERERWQPFLKRWSEEWISTHDPEKEEPLDEDVIRDAWLGFAPASAEEVAAAEARLGHSLPPSLREFLLVTNGWRNAGDFIDRLTGAAELEWLRDTADRDWIDAYGGYADKDEEDDGDVLGRSLRISLTGDACVLFLDPNDVDESGEWAAYELASWSGTGPVRHGSFHDLMYDLYTSFHALRKPAGQTRDHWDDRVEQARLAALAGEIDEPLAVLEEAEGFGRDRARLLRFQMLAMLGNWYTVVMSHIVLNRDDPAEFLQDPLFTEELLPLLFTEDRLTHRRERATLQLLMQRGGESMQLLIAEYQARLRDPGSRLTFGNPEFDTAVHQIIDRLTADPAFRQQGPVTAPRSSPGIAAGLSFEDVGGVHEARRRLTDAAWPELREAIRLWRPVSEDHIAPVALFAHPVLAEMITADRGREILSMRRGDHE
ncbi:SMI1/KNR4 family protein [Actinomadura sp. HBU206391]|uniref:SMI1/KNR4 family protein n=1 Tax=Actinomadura sp. HBU206391 TaxID=2731692 RepID=UPI0016507B1D|nr:SMI1/KNR4 family protein [Actinomadura sp. HBU206391]MBC6456580.1 SMI1/KNR4 family protein [Actinomadura sp. HBU206391]